MKYLINIKILSLVISFICTLSVSSWERGSEAMTWPLNKKQKTRKAEERKKRHCNIPHYIHTELLSLVPRPKAGFSINERTSFLSSSSFCFPTIWPPLNHYRVMTFGHERGRGWRGDTHLVPFPAHPLHSTGHCSSACPARVFLFWLRAGPETCAHSSESTLARPWAGWYLWGWDILGSCPRVVKTKPSHWQISQLVEPNWFIKTDNLLRSSWWEQEGKGRSLFSF